MGIIAPDSEKNSERKNKIAPEKSSAKTGSSSKSSLPGLLVFLAFVIVFFFILVNAVIPKKSSSKKSAKAETQTSQATVNEVEELGGVKNEAELEEILNEIGASSSAQENLLPYEKTSYSHSYSKDSDGLYDFTNCVIDDASLLSTSEYTELSSYLANLNKTSGVQIAVLTVKSLNGEDIETFSLSHAEKWGLGQKNVDNGALLTVAFDEKEIRIETGYGTEAALTDAKCARIIRNVIAPSFQTGKYGEGIIEGVKNMAGIITQDESLVQEDVANETSKNSSSSSIPIIIILVIFFLFYFRAIIYGITHRGHSRSSRGVYRNNNFYSSSNSHHSSGNFGSGGSSFHGGGGHFGGGGASGHW